MSADERIAEIGELLARDLIRLRARNASQLSADRVYPSAEGRLAARRADCESALVRSPYEHT